MFQFKNQIRVTMAMGILSVLAGILAHLALTDIYHAEGDLALEWNVLRFSAAIILGFIAASLWVLGKALKAML